jgi:hypothetical protein
VVGRYTTCFSFSKINRRSKNEIVTFSRRLRSSNRANVGSSSRTVNGIVSEGGFFVLGLFIDGFSYVDGDESQERSVR